MRYRSEKHRLPPLNMNGILLVDKPATWTSHDVVNFIRNRFNVPKVGHCGTLDPAATGLLVIVTGSFTKLSQKFSGDNKAYEAVMLLGKETDSMDLDGTVTSEKDYSNITEAQVREAVMSFVGDQLQIPPMVSATKKDGQRLYELARRGIEVEREPKPITIFEIDIKKIEIPYVEFSVRCSKGTYVRSLCSDIGNKLGCGAVLSGLRRTESGVFNIADAVQVEPMKDWDQTELAETVRNFLHNRLPSMLQI